MDNQPIIIKNGRSNIVSIIALVIILILAYMHFFKTDDSFAIREQILQTQIDSLKTKVSEYKSERDSLDNNIHNLNDSLFNLQSFEIKEFSESLICCSTTGCLPPTISNILSLEILGQI